MRVLILGGTTEASAIARALAGDARFAPVLSLAGRTRAPVPPSPYRWRCGGFGGAAGTRRLSRVRGTGRCCSIDATHPFAARISANAAAAAARTGVPRRRPCMRPAMGRRSRAIDWLRRRDASPRRSAALGAHAATRVSRPSAAGRGRRLRAGATARLPRALRRSGRPRHRRGPRMTQLLSRGPFAEGGRDWRSAPAALRRSSVLVSKNSGGGDDRGRQDRMRRAALGVPVVMVARPPDPPAWAGLELTGSVAGVLALARSCSQGRRCRAAYRASAGPVASRDDAGLRRSRSMMLGSRMSAAVVGSASAIVAMDHAARPCRPTAASEHDGCGGGQDLAPSTSNAAPSCHGPGAADRVVEREHEPRARRRRSGRRVRRPQGLRLSDSERAQKSWPSGAPSRAAAASRAEMPGTTSMSSAA